MTTFLINIVDGVFRPSVAALTIVIGVALFTVEQNSGPASLHAIKLDGSQCTGTLHYVCKAFSF